MWFCGRTMRLLFVYCTITILWLVTIAGIKCDLSFEDCWSLGFDRAILQRSSCDLLEQHDLLPLKTICDQCSIAGVDTDVVGTETKTSRAVLEYCTCKFEMFPQVKAFVENSDRFARHFPALSFQHIFGINPRLKLYDRHGNLLRQMDIHKWDTDAITEYLHSIFPHSN